jgi:HlyD family secretion protein
LSPERGSKRYPLLAVGGLIVGLAAGLVYGPRLAAKKSDGKTSTGMTSPLSSAPVTGEKPIVTAIGRLRPGNGVLRIAGPSQLVVVVGRLMVEEGDRVRKGQVLALLDTHASQLASVERLKATVESQIAAAARADAEMRTMKNEYGRIERLHRDGTVSDSQRDTSKLQADTAQADLRRAEAELNLARADLQRGQEDLELTVVRAPINGRVLKVHCRDGEKVGNDGIIELADNGVMYAVAEVYETDVSKIHVGQHATVKTPLLDHELTGVVERVGMKIGKLDILGTDPASKTDARVVEVEVRLDEGSEVSTATNLQVVVSIDVSGLQAVSARQVRKGSPGTAQ